MGSESNVTNFKVGDKVRILDVTEIYSAERAGYETGGIYPVVEIDKHGDPIISNGEEELCFFRGELKYLEKVSSKPTKNQRITALESEVAALTRRIEALEQGKSYTHTSRISEQVAKPLTPNQARKAIIDEAKAFVADVTKRMRADTNNDEGNGTFKYLATKPEFHVNKAKRTVVVLVKGVYNPKLYERGIAKCAPDDVFNADIGKAIALGRALGLDVSKFEQAVKPTEVAVGQRVFCGEDSYPTARNGVHTIKSVPKEGFHHGGAFVDAFNRDRDDKLTWVEIVHLTITDDTGAEY